MICVPVTWKSASFHLCSDNQIVNNFIHLSQHLFKKPDAEHPDKKNMIFPEKAQPGFSIAQANKLIRSTILVIFVSFAIGSIGCSQFHTSTSHWNNIDKLGYCPFYDVHSKEKFSTKLDNINHPILGTIINDILPKEKSQPSTKIDLDDPVAIYLVDQNNIWPHLRKHFSLDLSLNNKKIRSQRNWYVKHQKYMHRVLSRSEPYIFHISQEIKKRDLPMELVLLPIVESAYDPFAYSHGQASGIWQFIPATGKRFGLKQNWWYDGRRDITASTRAALDYMEYLNKRFKGNWLHALAAYNSGEGTVLKAIRKNKKRNRPTDFWSLSLPKETRAYVPKLIALAQIINEPDVYNTSIKPIDNFAYFEKVELKGQIDLAQAATMAGLELNALYQLNPGFNRWATDPDGPHHLLIPVQQADIFRDALQQLSPEGQVSWKRYSIKSGDNLSEIAKEHHITTALLKKINRLSSNRIRAGHTLLIPSSAKNLNQYQLTSRQRLITRQQRNVPGKSKIKHKIKSGESLWSLSKKYKVSISSLARWNNMSPKDPLRIGQNLAIWTGSKQQNNNGPQVVRKVHYKVRKGDSLSRIASKFNVRVAQLTQWNDLGKKKYLQPGQSITLFVDVTKLTL